MKIIDKLSILLATGFGVGYSKRAPGTLGSLVGLPAGAWLAASDLNTASRLLVLIGACMFGFLITARAEHILTTHDDQRIVMDEIVGQMIAVGFFPATVLNLILGFALFRLFDIWKPGPIGYIDEQLPGAVGTFFDDVLAGIAAASVLYFLQVS